MSNVVLFNPDDTIVANRVDRYLISVNTPDYSDREDAIVNPDLSAVTNVEQKYWKVSGAQVVEMVQEEKDLIDVPLSTPEPTRIELFAAILGASASLEQLDRFLNALDHYPSFSAALDNKNYTLARTRLSKALTNNKIIQEDYDLVDSIIPVD